MLGLHFIFAGFCWEQTLNKIMNETWGLYLAEKTLLSTFIPIYIFPSWFWFQNVNIQCHLYWQLSESKCIKSKATINSSDSTEYSVLHKYVTVGQKSSQLFNIPCKNFINKWRTWCFATTRGRCSSYLDDKHICRQSCFVGWTNELQDKVDESEIVTLCVFTVLSETLFDFDQSEGTKDLQN